MLNPADSGQPQEPSAEQQWFDASCEDRWLTSYDGLTLHGCYIPQVQDSHLYAVVCHGYGSEPSGMADYAAGSMTWAFPSWPPLPRGHEQSQGDYVGMGWHERHDIVDWINTLVEQDPEAPDPAVRRVHGGRHGDDGVRGGAARQREMHHRRLRLHLCVG